MTAPARPHWNASKRGWMREARPRLRSTSSRSTNCRRSRRIPLLAPAPPSPRSSNARARPGEPRTKPAPPSSLTGTSTTPPRRVGKTTQLAPQTSKRGRTNATSTARMPRPFRAGLGIRPGLYPARSCSNASDEGMNWSGRSRTPSHHASHTYTPSAVLSPPLLCRTSVAIKSSSAIVARSTS